MAFKARMKNMAQVSIKRVVVKLVGTILMLWIGGTILNEIGAVMEGTCSPFYKGVTLIGWGLHTGNATDDAGCLGDVNTLDKNLAGGGVLTVVGIIGLASIVLEFVDLRF